MPLTNNVHSTREVTSMTASSFKEFLYQHHSNAHQLKDVFRCAYGTAWKKVRNPELITVGDLLNMDACGVASLDELFGVIKELRK